MKLTLFLLCSWLMIAPILAETIGSVEYQLPKGWIVGNKTDDENGTTIIYIPKDASGEDLTEYFGVNANEYPPDLEDIEKFKSLFTEEYPDMQVDVNILEKNKNSLLYEWSVKDKGKERAHGWGRAFATKEGTVLLEYQTEEPSSVSNSRNIWLPVLKQAKILQEKASKKDDADH